MASILDENFDSLNLGELDNQNSWAAAAQYEQSVQVQDSVVQGGTKAVLCGTSATTGSTDIFKSGVSASSDTYGAYLSRNASGTGNVLIRLTESGTTRASFGLRDSGFKYYNGSAWTAFNASAAFELNTWYFVEAQWGPSGTNIRYRVDEGAWNNYDTPHASWTTMDGVGMTFYNATNNHIGYVDTLGQATNITISASVLGATASIQSPAITEGAGAVITATELLGSFSAQVPSIVEGVGVTVTGLNAPSATFSALTPTIESVFWTQVGKNSTAYSNTSKHSTSYNNQTKNTNAWTFQDKRT